MKRWAIGAGLLALCTIKIAFGDPTATRNKISQSQLEKIKLEIPHIVGEWESFKQSNGEYVCSPLVGFYIKNTGKEIGNLFLTADFLDTKNKTVFSSGSEIINSIPAGYTSIAKVIAIPVTLIIVLILVF